MQPKLQLLPFWTGLHCQEKCPTGSHGPECSRTCKCENESKCHHVDGICDCSSGFFGQTCEKVCPENFHGLNCTQRCDCLNAKSCNPRTGHCNCKIGYADPRCSAPCPYGLYGEGCRHKCRCDNLLIQHCHPEIGCVCTFGVKKDERNLSSDMNVGVDDCIDPVTGSLPMIHPLFYAHDGQQKWAPPNDSDATPAWIQRLIVVLSLAAAACAILFFLFCRSDDGSDAGIKHCYSNATFNVASQSVTLQPSQHDVEVELPDYCNIIQSPVSMTETENRPQSQLTELSGSTLHIYDVPHPVPAIQSSPEQN